MNQAKQKVHCGEDEHSKYPAAQMVVCDNCGRDNCPDCLSYVSERCYWCESELNNENE